MRKFIIAALAATTMIPAALAPVAAQAQSAREVRESAREVRHDKRDVRQAARYGDRRDVRDAKHDLRDSRQELREDWRDYKRAHPATYRRPAYVGPRGYAYRPVSVGYRFAPAYYGSRYVIADYGRYRLPRPYANSRWVRYGNDVVMVNVRTGSTLVVYRGFFG
jgi:Ni/Co efflux regulator RcnB